MLDFRPFRITIERRGGARFILKDVIACSEGGKVYAYFQLSENRPGRIYRRRCKLLTPSPKKPLLKINGFFVRV